MTTAFFTLGKKYRVTITDPETSEVITEYNDYYYGCEVDRTDHWYRFSVLAPEEREAKRVLGNQGYQPTGQPVDLSKISPPQTPSPASKPKN